MATRSEIYNWFLTGKFPSQAQFWASWDSFWHKDDTIPQNSIQNLPTALNAKANKADTDAHAANADAHNLNARLAAKSNTGHTHNIADVTGLTEALANATIPDASTTVKGKVQLAGDLAGTAEAPTVPNALKKNANPAYENLADTSDKYGFALFSRLGAVFRSSKLLWDEALSKLTIKGSQAVWEATGDVTDGNMGIKVLDSANESFKIYDSISNFFSTGLKSGKRVVQVFTAFRLVNGVANNETEFKAEICEGSVTTLFKSIDVPNDSILTIDISNICVMNIDKASLFGFAQFTFKNDAGTVTDISHTDFKYGRQYSRIKSSAGIVTGSDTRFDVSIVGTAVRINFVNTENKLVNAHCEIKHNVSVLPVAMT